MPRAVTTNAETPSLVPPRLIARCSERVRQGAEKFGGLDESAFVSAIGRSAAHRFPDGAPADSVAAYLESLHIEDLALATACAVGRDAAWDYFIRTFRPDLYAAARALCPRDEAASRELADSLYAELFGVRGESSEPRSLFLYYHGRSKLSTWLRSILAQRRIDQVRAARRTESLDESEVEAPGNLSGWRAKPQTPDSGPDLDRPRLLTLLQAALTAALTALAPRDRLRLSYYYLQDLTLAQIGRLTREHEATVSRHLERTRRELRKSVERTLREEKRLSDAQLKLCFEYAAAEWPFDLSRALRSDGTG
jgi:RNA polymerase sigma-70 factor (ECF subfamily)